MLDPGPLHRVTAVGRQALDGRDFVPDGARGRRAAGADRPAVQVHGTDAALRDAATELRAGQADRVTQDPQERRLGFDIHFVRRAVDR